MCRKSFSHHRWSSTHDRIWIIIFQSLYAIFLARGSRFSIAIAILKYQQENSYLITFKWNHFIISSSFIWYFLIFNVFCLLLPCPILFCFVLFLFCFVLLLLFCFVCCVFWIWIFLLKNLDPLFWIWILFDGRSE